MARSGGRNQTGRRDWSRFRIAGVAVIFGLCWLALWARAFQVQILQGDALARMAGPQHIAAEFVSGERGRILDRQGRVLAKSVEVNSLYARPGEIKDVRVAAHDLGKILRKPAKEIAEKLGSKEPFVWIERQVADREAAYVRDLDRPGLYLVTEYRRLYPNGHLAGQLLGFVGVDGQGLEGLERSFEERLAGKSVRLAVSRDASGKRLYLDAKAREAAVVGGDVTLTLDADIQCVAERALERAVSGYQGVSGVCLAVDVKTGEILAWAQYPFFNPNIYEKYEPKTWRNRVALDALEPGSTLKPFLVAAAIQEGVVKEDTKYFCENGKWHIPGASFSDSHPHGRLPVHKIIRYSSNIGAAKIGLDLGAETYHSYLRKLGFGERPGLPLPGEAKGILHDPGSWKKVDLAAASFGQGVAVTAAQLAKAYLCLANQGSLRPLKLVREFSLTHARQEKVFDPRVAEQVLAMLYDAVEKDGTGTEARIQGVSVGGKTGTAQKASLSGGYGDKYLASFAAFIPALRPEYFILVMVDEPHPGHLGGVVAAPAVREVAVHSLAYLGKLPE
ncbi:MAG: penicillin-binding protein 2, partial [Thermodesulfobacteriota bacterium]|nr:penicillin-binding protein 2 [Thermodesulfobacteriota bacterium]